MLTKTFVVDVTVDEQGDHTDATAHLEVGDMRVDGWGRARRNPVDPNRPRLGDELAAARALSDLARHLVDDVEIQISRQEGRPAHIAL
jgi:hypothetical protein